MVSGAVTLEQIFEPDGLLASHLPHYEYRPSQLEMAQEILDAIQHRRHLCIEAGTGTGKTLAYLIPALFSQKRVIVSTATKNLQEQLFKKDIPFIRQFIDPELRASYMKGRQNYLCLDKLGELHGGFLPLDEGLSEVSQRLRDWAERTATGDRAELDWIGQTGDLWSGMDARSDSCSGQKCRLFKECFITRMRQRALESDLIVVNHALFFANLALESDEIGTVLPEFAAVILDEAHGVEDIAASFLGRRLSSVQIEEWIRDCRATLRAEAPHSSLEKLERASTRFFSELPAGRRQRTSLNFFQQDDGSVVDLRLDLEMPLESLMEALHMLRHKLGQIQLPSEAQPLPRRLAEMAQTLAVIFDAEDRANVGWFERRARGTFLNHTPIRVADVLRERLFDRVDSAILTSATLTAAGSFDYLKDRLGVESPREVVVAGEFDFESQAMLYIPRDLPEPRSPEYFELALDRIRKLLALTDGHAFLLFTSVRQMQRVHGALAENPEYPLLLQGRQPRNRLLEQFRERPRSVLCATSSFWQGVDVRGDALRSVVIDKLPFQVPTEPVVAARLQSLQDDGLDPFSLYTLPSAILTLRQGLGRLIRSRRDHGILTVLDSRIWTRRYGSEVLSSLPNCRVTDNIEELRNFYDPTGSDSPALHPPGP